MLEVKNIKYSYNSDYQALNGVSLKVNKGEMVALLGKNGAGKSTLFLHLNGIYQPDEGQVFIDGEELKYDKKSLLKFRQKVGIVFQNPDDQIFAPTVEEDVAFGPLNLGLPMEEVQDRVEEALSFLLCVRPLLRTPSANPSIPMKTAPFPMVVST